MEERRCETRYCLGTPAKHRKKCPKCMSREWRLKYPARDAFRHWRDNAKRRGIPFSATLDYFERWCKRTNYLALRGLGADDMTIDCNDNFIGYVDGGYTMKTRSQNSREGKKGKRPAYVKQAGDPF